MRLPPVGAECASIVLPLGILKQNDVNALFNLENEIFIHVYRDGVLSCDELTCSADVVLPLYGSTCGVIRLSEMRKNGLAGAILKFEQWELSNEVGEDRHALRHDWIKAFRVLGYSPMVSGPREGEERTGVKRLSCILTSSARYHAGNYLSIWSG